MRLNELPEHDNNKEDASSDQPPKPGREELSRFFESADTNSQLEMRIALKMQNRAQVLDLLEAGGYIPVNNKEAQDPRFKTALTVDIKPGEVQRQAKKMGFTTDRAGVPPLLHKSAAKNTSANKAYNIGLAEDANRSPQVTQADLNALEQYADKLFGKVGIDVEFTRHFLDRVNDERNLKQITIAELTRLFKQEYKRWGKRIAQLGPDAQAVMKDMRTDVNMPFVLTWDAQNQELDLVAKTVMRKKDFKTSNQEFAIEDGPLATIQRAVAPKIKRKAYDYAAKTLHDVIQRKKATGQKLVHTLEYYAQRVGNSIKGIDYRALTDYYIEQYGTPESYTDLERSVLESGYSLDDLDENFANGKKINEKLKYQSSLSKKIFNPSGYIENQGDSIYGLWLPLSDSIVNKIIPKQRARVFHVTGVGNINKMFNLQGQKKSISAFTNMDSYYLDKGIVSGGGGGVIFELDANVLGAFNQDVESAPDTGGRRWITLDALIEFSGKNRNDLKPMYGEMAKLIQSLLDKHAPDMDYTDEYDDYELTVDKWTELGQKLTADGDGKKISVLIKDYIDGVYAIMIKHAKPIGQALQSSLSDSEGLDTDWNEIVVNDIKVLQMHVLKDSVENLEKLKELESKGIKVRVWNSPQELSNYTKKVGAQQKLGENFADGKKKGKSRPGRVKRAGASCKGSVTDLRAKAKKYSGERGKMYHWCANMKSGKKK